MYKLRHFIIFLLQSLNEMSSGLKEAIATGNSPFPPDLKKLDHANGVALLMRMADREFYLSRQGLSQGMYINVLKEELSQFRGGDALRQ